MRQTRRNLLGAAAAGAGALLLPMRAWGSKDWPQRPVQLVMGYPSGGATDGVMRPLELTLQDKLGQPVVFDYRPGAGATIAATYTSRAKPDGYILHVTDSGPMTILPNGKPLPYDPRKDVTPIGLVCEGASILVAHPSVPVSNLKELIALAKQKPGYFHYGTSGLGGAAHLSGELFQAITGTTLSHIPYKGGSQAAIDLVGGQIPLAFASTGTALPFVKQGKMKPLAVTSRSRVSIFPDVPTVAESGYPDYDATVWFALVGPPGLPDDIVRKANAALQEALAAPDARRALLEQGYTPTPGTPSDLRQRIAADYEKWGSLIRDKQIIFQ